MKQSGNCPKCKSTNLIADAKVRDRAHHGLIHEFSVSTYRNPQAKVFKETRISTVSAWVCAACGYTEFYADTPRTLQA